MSKRKHPLHPTPCATFLSTYCAVVFKRDARYRTIFTFHKDAVKLVLEEMGTYPGTNGEVHLSKFEVSPKYRGCGLASIALDALVKGADLHSITLTLSPTSYADQHGGLAQRNLEAFYRRYGFRGVRGRVETNAVHYKRIHEMARIPRR